MTETYDKIDWYYGWNGGPCPVHPETEVSIINGARLPYAAKAQSFDWTWYDTPEGNIIAFRITKLYREPRKAREWWIRKSLMPFGSELYSLYSTLEAASEQGPNTILEIIHVREVLGDDDAY